MVFMSLICVELVELFTLHGERPCAIFNFQTRASQMHCNVSDNSGRQGDYSFLYCDFRFYCSFSTACPQVITLTALQKGDALVGAHNYRVVRTHRQPNGHSFYP